MAQLRFDLDGTSQTLVELRRACMDNPAMNLREKLKGGHMRVEWPHTRPEPTGRVRAKLIRDRMHQAHRTELKFGKENPGTALANLSTIFTIVITMPAVAFSLYWLCQWFGIGETTSKLIAVIGGLISFVVEIALAFIQTWKLEHRHRGPRIMALS